MIRPWISMLLLGFLLITSACAVDLQRGRQARSNTPFSSFFKGLPARIWARDKYLEDYIIARPHGLAKRQDNVPSASINTPLDTPGRDSSVTPTPTPPTSTADPTTTSVPPPETTTPPPPSSTTTPPPPETTNSQGPPEPTPTPQPTPQPPSSINNPSRGSSSRSTPLTTNNNPTTTPPPRTSTTLIPTTNSDGSLSTITSVIVVQPSPTNSQGSPSQRPPGLQTNTAPIITVDLEKGLLAVLGLSGAIAVVMAL
ncbi:hypothetical protein HCBG_04365 [Histoplasma capsulatum G186AR]|uniref:Uncharacterized protein n=2 Tax=Ajellomyces capsulatus TaxID=5037 RepID=C0NLI5_AJECG|nr:uncharacterized protein HCBG_04365 [Histoplasma capsulatum G186AR]EEH07485.1 hypothetical protein HCBG_04365 [Histoplasma capsulatum G186AR]KAG5304365.1 hypothetical protein I7I52_02675 [Histoplasma capsulatum]QSS69963.1 hypothetical protein I7I50_11437 [Histoplasma capsulatum G186AR]